jgi:hypothetical protein
MRVPLSKEYRGHLGPVLAIEVREPTGAQLLVHGEPWEVAQTATGGSVVIENREAVKAYLEACCDPGIDVLAQLSVQDFRAVKAALQGFFIPRASESTEGST